MRHAALYLCTVLALAACQPAGRRPPPTSVPPPSAQRQAPPVDTCAGVPVSGIPLSLVHRDTAVLPDAYLRGMLDALTPPTRRMLPAERHRPVIDFVVRRDGSVSDIALRTRSGDREFDMRMLSAIEIAGMRRAFGVFPLGVGAAAVPVTLRFGQRLAPGEDGLQVEPVDQHATANPRNPPAALPSSAGGPGEVLATFTVDTAGRVELASLTLAPPLGEPAAAAVRDVLRQWRYYPATVRGCKVQETVQVPFHSPPGR